MGKHIVNRRGEKEEFDEKKLYASIYHPAREAEYSEEEAEELAEKVCDTVSEWVEEEDVVTSQEIRQRTIEALEEEDEDIAFLYKTHLDVN